jgi:ABC-2 type transport system permease protein
MMFCLLRASAKAQVIYKADFIIGVIGTLFYNGAFLASIGIITARFNDIGGFTAWEIAFLFGLFELGHSVYGFFLKNMSSNLNDYVMDGTLDIYFLRPYGILTQLNGNKMYFPVFVDVVIGAACMAAAVLNLNLRFGPVHWLFTVIFIISGGFIEFGLALLMNCATMLFPNTKSLYGAYYQLVLVSQRYPLNIFARGFQGLLTFVFPLGFMNYYPTLFLLGKPGGWIGCLAPLVAVAFVFVGVNVFNLTLRHYSSTGN